MAKGLKPGGAYNVTDNSEEMITLISGLMKVPFTQEMINEREKYLSSDYNNMVNTGKLISLI